MRRSWSLSRALQGGLVELDGTTPLQLGVTKWRTLVTYVPQTRVHPKGTPSEFYFTVQVDLHPHSVLLGRIADVVDTSAHPDRPLPISEPSL